jgi:hypothetical protein
MNRLNFENNMPQMSLNKGTSEFISLDWVKNPLNLMICYAHLE